VTRTFVACFVDIGHFLVVLVAAFMSFTVAGMMLFGHRTIEFCSLRIAVHQCFLVMLGSFDYEKLADEHRVTAALWFFLFSFTVSIVLLNMALAIIIDVHTEVVSDMSESKDTIWTQASNIIFHCKHRHNWLSLRKVEDAVRASELREVSADELRMMLPDMPRVQATGLIDTVEQHLAMQEHKGISLSDAVHLAVKIRNDVTRMGGSMTEMVRLEGDNIKALTSLFRDRAVDPVTGLPQDANLASLDEDHNHRLHIVERRLLTLEESVKEAMKTTVAGAKDMRNMLTIIEDLVRTPQERSDWGDD